MTPAAGEPARRGGARALALCLGAAGAAALAFATRGWWDAPRAPASVRFHVAEPPPASAAPARPAAGAEPAWRYHLDAATVERLYGLLDDPRYAYDPFVYFRDAGNLDDVFPRPEHPDRRWRWKTNSLGCREDHELDQPPRERRVLVAGDSHTCGLCNADESFANLLEARLARADPGRTVEVLNAALGGYTFPQYLGTFLRFRDFAPQHCVVGVFGGNDFAELIALDQTFTGRPWRALPEEEQRRRAAALEHSPDALGQGLNALQTFRMWPEEEPAMVRRAVELCAELDALARGHGAQVTIVYLPSPFDFEWPKLPQRAIDARAALELSAEDERTNRRMGEAFLAGLAQAGVAAIDMRASFERESAPPYWGIDFHLNLRGHELVAEALEARLR